jgi:DNA-binding CsgD family transcriptional regulator
VNRDLLSAAGIKGGNTSKHRWTEEERQIVRRDYKGTNNSAQEIANRLRVTRCAVKGQVQNMGIAMQKSPPWTKDEIERLEELIHRLSVSQIAKRLHRSCNAVKVKATRLKLKLRLRDDWYTKMEVAEICGVDHKKVQNWIDTRALRASWHNGTRPQKNGMAMWHIEAKDLKDFIINYSGELLGRNVDIQQIVWLLEA